MPLLPGKSEIGHNITEMEKAGHKRSQAVAAALNVARKTRAAGGDVAANSNHAKSDKQKALEGALAAIPGRLPRHDPSAPRSATEAFEQAAEGANAARAEAKAAHERGNIPLKPGQRFHTPKTRDNGEPPYEVQTHYVNPVTGHAGYYVKQHFGDNDPRSRSFPVAAPPERRAEWMPMGGLVAAKADGGEVSTHLPFPDSLNLPAPPTHEDMKRHSRREDVPLHTARATQTSMDWRKPGERTNPGALIEGYEDLPVAVRKETGEHLIFDGHHRTVSAINSGHQSMPMHVIDAKRYDPENAGRAPAAESGLPMRRGMSDDEILKELGYADGDVERQARASGGEVSDGAVHTGPIHSIVAGRTDHLPMHVPSGSYVIPADIISAMGEGNTMAGYAHIKRMFSTAPRDPGDDSGSKVPIVAAGGEYVLSPDEVRHAGGGDIDAGHAALDDFVKRYRAKTIKTLSKLPGPVKD